MVQKRQRFFVCVPYHPVYTILGPSLDRCLADPLINVGKRVNVALPLVALKSLCISPKGLGTLCSVSARCSTSAWGDASKND